MCHVQCFWLQYPNFHQFPPFYAANKKVSRTFPNAPDLSQTRHHGNELFIPGAAKLQARPPSAHPPWCRSPFSVLCYLSTCYLSQPLRYMPFFLQLTEDVLRSFGQALKDSVQRGDLRLDLSSEDSAGPPITITPSAQGIPPAAASGEEPAAAGESSLPQR